MASSYFAAVSDEAALVLNSVKVNGRAALVSAFPDRLVVVTSDGTRAIPIGDLARIAHKAGVRTGKLILTTVDNEQLVVSGLRSRDTPTAYQIIVSLATDAQ